MDISTTQKIKVKMSFETILRKSFVNSLKEYARNCSLAGAKQMCNPDIGILQRIIWIAVFCSSLATVGYYLQYIWSDILTKPFIVTLESAEYPTKDLDFPAVAICNINRISKTALARFALEEYAELSQKESMEEVQQMLVNLGRLIDSSYNETLRTHPVFVRMINKYRLNDQRIVEVMKLLAPSCEDLLRECSWDGKQVDCKDLFAMRRIVNRGHCCTFNYVLNFHTFGKLEKSNIEIQKQEMHGFDHGLNVVLDPMLDDYAYPLRGVEGFDVFIFDPMQFPDPSAGRVIHRIADPNTAVYLELVTTKQVATKEVRKYKVETVQTPTKNGLFLAQDTVALTCLIRKCLFHNELGGLFSNMYSYSTCIILCKLQTVESLCQCTPYFYSTHQNNRKTPVCTLENLKCLNKYKEKLFYLYPYNAEDLTGLETELQDSLDCPYCLPDCEITQHTTKSYEVPLNMVDMQKTLSRVLSYTNFDYALIFSNASNLTYLSIYYPTQDATLVKLDVVFYWFEILSNLGGFCGICVGFTLSSVAEIVYYFTIRYIQHCCINYKKYH